MRPSALRTPALLAVLLAAACQSPTYVDQLPPEDFFDPGDPSSGPYTSGSNGQTGRDAGCVAKTCGALGVFCGTASDGCGGTLNCGGCAAPQTCGGDGTPGICGCTPTKVCTAGVDCSTVPNGCGTLLDCGACEAGKVCGASQPNVCGTGTCTPETDAAFCARLGRGCGPVTGGDNCGASRTVASCGACTAPQTCSAAGICSCQPESDVAFCARQGKECGGVAAKDNCGQDRAAGCGTCAGTLVCAANVCTSPGSPDAGAATDAASGADAEAAGPDASAGDTGPLACPEASRLCAHTFAYQGSGAEQAVSVRGSFDSWGAGQAMTSGAANAWSASVPVPWNTKVLYKYVVDGNWIADPANPKSENDGYGGKNSVLDPETCADWTCSGPVGCTATSCTGATPSCNTTTGACECTTTSCAAGERCSAAKACEVIPVGTGPHLELVAPPTVGADSYSFQVKFVPDASGAELDEAATTVLLNGVATSATYEVASRTWTVQAASGVSLGKYSFHFKAKDTAGKGARLFVPFWVEPQPFQWKDAFLYQIMTDRFVNGTAANDSPVAGVDPAAQWQGGDFRGVIKKLEGAVTASDPGYFEQLGVNTIWLSSPVTSTEAAEPGKGEGAGHTFSGFHAYWPVATGWTYENQWSGMASPIEKRFGTEAELKELVEKAHARGLRVLVDFVPNHVHVDAPLFQAHGTDSNWFNLPYLDCGPYWDSVPENKYCWFDPFLPDFNTTNATVNETIASHAVWLIQEFNLDGFRVDATKHVYNNVLTAMRARIDQQVSTTGLHFYMVGESLGGNEGQVKDCMGPTKLDGSVNDPLHYAIVDAFLTRTSSANDLENAVRYDEYTWTNGFPEALMGHFMGSHDTARAISIAANNVGSPWSGQPGVPTDFRPFGRLRLAQAFLFTYNSIPIVWMGDEYGQPGSRDPDNRRMMKFDSDLTQLQKDTLDHARKLGKARLSHSALRRGSRKTLLTENEFYAYARADGSDVVVVVLNLSESSATRTVDVGSIGLTGTVKDALAGTSVTVSGSSLPVTLSGLSAAVFTK